MELVGLQMPQNSLGRAPLHGIHRTPIKPTLMNLNIIIAHLRFLESNFYLWPFKELHFVATLKPKQVRMVILCHYQAQKLIAEKGSHHFYFL
jgi:hypothetical protein